LNKGKAAVPSLRRRPVPA